MDPPPGKARAVIANSPDVLNHGRPTAVLASAGKRYRHDLAAGKEILWIVGARQLEPSLLYDGITGGVKTRSPRETGWFAM